MTGFAGNGMIYGTLSAIILTDIINTGLFDTNWIKPIAGFVNFVKEGADVVSSFIKGKFETEKIKELLEISAGEAKVVKHEGHTLAIYKDENHNVYILNATCIHIKCTVGWNASEQTCDCPCHGARYHPMVKC